MEAAAPRAVVTEASPTAARSAGAIAEVTEVEEATTITEEATEAEAEAAAGAVAETTGEFFVQLALFSWSVRARGKERPVASPLEE